MKHRGAGHGVVGRQPKRFKQLRFRQLRALVQLAEQGSFAAAAKRLGLAATSVWQQVRSLETLLGKEFVHAEGRTLSLTPAGQRLLALASPLVRGFDDLEASFVEEAPEPGKSLTLAAPSAYLVHDLPRLWARFRAEHADVSLRLLERDSASCIRLVEQGEADLAVAGMLDDPLPSGLASRRLARHPFMFVCPADHPLATAARLSLAAIARQDLVLNAEGGNARSRIAVVLGKAGLRRSLHVAMEAAGDEPLLDFVRKGFGVAVVPMSPAAAAEATAAGGRLVFRDVSRLFGHETVSLVYRRFHCQSAHERALSELLTTSAAAGGENGSRRKQAPKGCSQADAH